MKAFVDFKFPDPSFWESYTQLWNNSQTRSVFQAPHYIRFLARRYPADLAVYQYYLDDQLSGAAFFRKEGRTYRLLTDVKSDHNFFILHNNCTERDIHCFFENLFGCIREQDWALILKNQPIWAGYWTTFLTAGQNHNLYYSVEAYSKCLVVEKENPGALFDVLSKSRNTKTKINRLSREHEAVYETFTADEDLEAWAAGFCKTHIKRWQNTGTPSRYEEAGAEKFLYGCLKSWYDEGVLVRFSIKAGGERIAYSICLRQNDTLIYHSPAFDTDYQRYSPGKILISMIGEWMKTNRLSKLDFGEGAEIYKYDYSDAERGLSRVFISQHLNLPFILRSEYRKFYRKQAKKHAWLKKLYYDKILSTIKKTKVLVNAKICFIESMLDPHLDFYFVQLGI